eukprot:3707377-Rhodomonas_salina.1
MLGTLRAMILRACYEIYSTSTDTDILLPGSSKLACATASLPLLFNAFRTFRDATLPCFVLVPRSGSVPVLPRYRRVVTIVARCELVVWTMAGGCSEGAEGVLGGVSVAGSCLHPRPCTLHSRP